MKINEFFVNGFGVFHSTKVTDLSSGLNLFCGDNEAGKSTLLAFFRAILFGFETGRSNYNSYQPLSGGEHGGWICLEHSRGEMYSIERAPGTAAGQVSVRLPDSTITDGSKIEQLLPGVTKDLYRNVFAFSLDELQNIASIENDEIGSRIYSYGAGAGRV